MLDTVTVNKIFKNPFLKIGEMINLFLEEIPLPPSLRPIQFLLLFINLPEGKVNSFFAAQAIKASGKTRHQKEEKEEEYQKKDFEMASFFQRPAGESNFWGRTGLLSWSKKFETLGGRFAKGFFLAKGIREESQLGRDTKEEKCQFFNEDGPAMQLPSLF